MGKEKRSYKETVITVVNGNISSENLPSPLLTKEG